MGRTAASPGSSVRTGPRRPMTSPPQAPPFGLEALSTQGLTSQTASAQAAPQVVGRLVLTRVGGDGPPGHWNLWVLTGGPTITYADPRDASVRADILVDDVAPTVTANEAIRYIYNLGFFTSRFAETRHSRAPTLRLDAPIPYVLSGNRRGRLQPHVRRARNGNWVVTCQCADVQRTLKHLFVP